MSCGHIALDKVGIKVNNYFASEIKDIAIKVTMDNYTETIQIGDVNNVTYKNGI
jgi:DNA (cytosine-5)-methyltransferase 3A